MRRKLLALLITGTLLYAVRVYAHHSFAATYFPDTTVTIKGKLVEFLFRNPHSFVHVMAPDENGQMQRWAVEWGAAGQLGGQGMTRYTLRVGDEVIITGNPARTPGDHRLRMQTLRRPSDGLAWGTRPGEVVE